LNLSKTLASVTHSINNGNLQPIEKANSHISGKLGAKVPSSWHIKNGLGMQYLKTAIKDIIPKTARSFQSALFSKNL